MTLTLCSIFRDAAGYLPRYQAQVAALRVRHDVRLVVAEGDSSDDTLDRLKDWLGPDDTLVKHDHGGPAFGSVDHPQRWAQVAGVVRATLDAVVDPGPALVWVEADLVWRPEAIAALVADLDEAAAVAPLVLIGASDRFYDTWGYRRGGVGFSQQRPWYSYDGGERLVPIDSCGSCFATSDWPTLSAWDGRWPYGAGGGLRLDPAVEVRHP